MTTQTRTIDGKEVSYHHTARTQGYVSRKSEGSKPIPYDGRFGKGFKIYRPAYDSTRYCFVEYWVKKG